MAGWTHEGPPWLEEVTIAFVLGGWVFTTSGPIYRFFPILEMVPLVGKAN